MTERGATKLTTAESAAHALSCLKILLPANAMFNEEAAKVRIACLAEMLEGDLAVAPDIRGARKEVDGLVYDLEKSVKAVSDAVRALENLGMAVWDELFGGMGANDALVGKWRGDPEKLLSGDDYDRTLELSHEIGEKYQKIKAAAVAAVAGDGYLDAIKAGIGRAPEKALQNHVERCAQHVAWLGGDVFIKQSEEGPFHHFVIAVAEMADVLSVSRRQFMAGVQSFLRSPKLDEPDPFSD